MGAKYGKDWQQEARQRNRRPLSAPLLEFGNVQALDWCELSLERCGAYVALLLAGLFLCCWEEDDVIAIGCHPAALLLCARVSPLRQVTPSLGAVLGHAVNLLITVMPLRLKSQIAANGASASMALSS